MYFDQKIAFGIILYNFNKRYYEHCIPISAIVIKLHLVVQSVVYCLDCEGRIGKWEETLLIQEGGFLGRGALNLRGGLITVHTLLVNRIKTSFVIYVGCMVSK